ncbi:protein of unknown function [Denitratisoma oestradiolicum]|uniref:Uncharacterized protein n=1 Tax=Denitratisoma oestradiolicum TaxID=311182 RepID=A0A6S6XPM2_9PROT|nr:protein of unknown function [Denitratisoma oestradiolicum]
MFSASLTVLGGIDVEHAIKGEVGDLRFAGQEVNQGDVV